MPMSEEEYNKRQKALQEEAEEARQVLNVARNRYDKICDKLRDLRIEWREGK